MSEKQKLEGWAERFILQLSYSDRKQTKHIDCYGLGVICPPKAHVLQVWSSVW